MKPEPDRAGLWSRVGVICQNSDKRWIEAGRISSTYQRRIPLTLASGIEFISVEGIKDCIEESTDHVMLFKMFEI